MFKFGEIGLTSQIQDRRATSSKVFEGRRLLFKKNKVTVIKGTATLVAPNRIQVKGEGAGATEVTAKSVIVATGSEAKSLPGYTVDEKRIISNVGALEMAAVPQSLFIVGAGAVGVEFASVYHLLEPRSRWSKCCRTSSRLRMRKFPRN
jgi:dihydrolipoamide dehydrogenase